MLLALGACGGGNKLDSGTAGTGSGNGNGNGSGGTTTYAMGNGSGSSFQSGVIGGIPSSMLSAGGTAGLTVTIVDSTGTLYTGASLDVTFNSPCISQGLATVSAAGTTVAGQTAGSFSTTTGTVTVTYAAKGCNGNDVITASATVGSTALSASGTINVAPAAVGSIMFVSATPSSIGLKGTGLGETSTVIFKVVDSTGGARPGVNVTFSLDSTVGGLTLSPASATSAADGTVQTVVSSGTAHTTVRVTATIASPALTTESSVLTVTTGIPSSNAFSIAVGPATYGTKTSTLACPNVEAWSIDGVMVPMTVRLADRYNNPAPDGTAVAFTTNGGHIVGSCMTPSDAQHLGDGTCSVTWTSAQPRPTTASVPPVAQNGRATILATAIGEEFFNDANGNGYYDSGEVFANLGEPYRDDNESGAYELGEYFLDFNKNATRDAGNGTFKGITCTGSSCSTSTLAISAPHLLIMSTSGANITFVGVSGGLSGNGNGLTIMHSASGSVLINVKDLNGNAMAAGTTVAVSADSAVGSIGQTPSPFVIGCDSGTTGANVSFSVTAAGTPGGGNIVIQVTSPSGTLTLGQIPVTVN
jgi:hypothetical protein